FSIAAALIGDLSGKYLAEYQPEKLAAAEWHFETTEDAPLLMYGILDGEEVKYALKVPYALSILAHGNPTAEVIVLDHFPDDEIPPVAVHYSFDFMVTNGVWMALLSLVFWVGTKRKWLVIERTPFRWLLVFGGPFSIIG